MKKLSLLIVIGLAMASAFGKPVEMKEVVIAGKVINRTENTPKVIKFNFCNPLIPGAQSAIINAKGEFIANQDMMYTQNMTVNILNHFINLYVKPGDSVHLTIDAAKLAEPNFNWLTIEGDDADISRQLNLCVNYLYRLPIPSNNINLPPEEMVLALKKDHERYLKMLDKYATDNHLDPMVKEWAKMDLKYMISNQIIDYGAMKNSAVAADALLKVYSDPFFDMYDPENFRSMMFRYHLGTYMHVLLKTDSTIAMRAKNSLVLTARRAVSVILKQPAGEGRDYMLYEYLTSSMNENPSILDSIPNLNQLFNKAVFVNQLKKVYEIKVKPSFPETLIKGINYLERTGNTVLLPTLDVFKYLRTKYKGKVIYIDVYATWCGPCQEEMKNTPALQQSMKGKDIVFVNLCLQSTESDWEKLIKDRKIEGENYFFTDDATKLFMGTYRLSGYPSYILMGKDGKIASMNAPRPSETSIVRKKILTLIND